jgi:PAS domain S-box-containing protein
MKLSFSINTLKVLVVEDNLGDFVIIEELLHEEIAEARITRCKSFKETQELLQVNKSFDVLLLDLSLPDASGENLVKSIVELAGHIPVIVLTGYTDKSYGIKTLQWGVSDYLLKDELESLQLFKSISYSIERKKAYNQLAESEAKYKDLFELSPIPIWLYDINTLKFLSVNEAALQHYGYSKDKFLSLTIKDIYCKEDLNILEDSIKKNEKVSGLCRHVKKNGEVINVQNESTVIDFNGVKAKLVLAIDVTEKLLAEAQLKKSEEALRRLNIELEQRVEERTKDLQEANRQLEAFTYSVSHDLESPLKSIIGLANILQSEANEKIPEEFHQYINHIAGLSYKMSGLIRNLLNFSRLGNENIIKDEINTRKLVLEIWNFLPKPENKNINFLVGDLPDVIGDKNMIEQAFVNLLSNAIKYSSKVSNQIIEVSTKNEDENVVFYIKDNGCGFDMKNYERLFTIFKRLHNSLEYEGTGVGLSIVKLIVEKHGGKIWAESQNGEGAVFYFTLPVKKETKSYTAS